MDDGFVLFGKTEEDQKRKKMESREQRGKKERRIK
jgi:hypothetical protein